MTREEIIQKAKCTVVPFIWTSHQPYYAEDYSEFLNTHEYKTCVCNCPYDRYVRLKDNEHHYTTNWHQKELLPKVVELFHIPFNENDFLWQRNVNENGDFSWYVPKTLQKYTIQTVILNNDLRKKIDFHKVTSNEITGCSQCVNSDWMERSLEDDYHKLFKFCHDCIYTHNETNQNEKSMIVIGDSQCIPEIPILMYYYEHVFVLDNRCHNFYTFEDLCLPQVENADVWMNHWEGNTLNQYIEMSLR